MPATMPATLPLKPSRFGNPGFFPRTPWPTQPVQQTAAEALAGLNPEVLEYLVRAMNQYGQNPTSGPQFLQPQENPPKAAQTITEGSLKGRAPKPFTGERTKALDFLSNFNTYWISNDNNSSMIIPYHRIAICLGFFEGDRIREWKDDQIRKLQDRVKNGTEP